MISERNINQYCSEDISLIENYWEAINDETQVWHCHHKNEFFRGIPVSKALLIDIGMYYGCPADELIFLTNSEHMSLHRNHMSRESRSKMNDSHRGYRFSDESKKKMSEAKKGKPSNRKGVKLSEEHKRKLSEAHMGKKRKPFTEEHRRRMSESKKAYYAKMRENQ